MYFFRRKRDAVNDAHIEREVQKIRKETFNSIDQANDSVERLNKLLEEDEGVTNLIFLATGGLNRMGPKRKTR